GYLTFPRFGPGVRRAAMAAMRAAGEISEIEVEGSRVPWLALTRDRPALARAARDQKGSRGTTLLSPFDSLLWYRERVARLFVFGSGEVSLAHVTPQRLRTPLSRALRAGVRLVGD